MIIDISIIQKYYLIKNVATKRVMDIPNGTDANSLQIRTWDENKTSAQLYKFNLKDDLIKKQEVHLTKKKKQIFVY